MSQKHHTDIAAPHWFRYMPKKWRPYLLLARLDRPIGVWLLLLPGLWGIALGSDWPVTGSFQPWIYGCLFVVGSIIMRAAGCVINDIFDRNIDKEVERTRVRPLAAGTITLARALIFLGALLFCAFILLLLLPPTAIALGILVVPLIIAYPLMKRITWWPQAFLGLTFNFSALMGLACMTNSIGWTGFCLYVSCIFWTLGYDTVYAYQDKEDDALVGVKSTARKFADQGKIWVSGFYALSIISLSGALFLQTNLIYAPAVLIPAAIHLFLQITEWSPDNPHSSLQIFKSNKTYGLLVLTGLAVLSALPDLILHIKF